MIDFNDKTQREAHWNAKADEVLVGRRITGARYMTDAEVKAMSIQNKAVIITLDDRTTLLIMSDDCGNNAGSIHYTRRDGLTDCLPRG